MEKRKIVAAVTLMVVLMASGAVLTPSVSALAQNYIILAFPHQLGEWATAWKS